MEGMQQISEAVLGKIRSDARKIIEEAEEQGRIEISKAEQLRAARHEEARRKILEDSQREAARIVSQASMKSRQALLETKVGIINEIINDVRNSLANTSNKGTSLLNLIKEAVKVIGQDRVRVYVAPKDMASARAVINSEAGLAARITEIKEYNCLGGAIIEDIDGKFRIDNTYETRLEMLLPRLMPDINKQLFGRKI